VQGPHRSADTTVTGFLEDGAVVVTLNGETLYPVVQASFTVGEDHVLTVSGGAFRGILVRLEADNGVDTSAALSEDSNLLRDASVCTAPVVGITHNSNAVKNEAEVILRLDEASEVSLDITVVILLDSAESIYYYSAFALAAVDPSEADSSVPSGAPSELPSSSPVSASDAPSLSPSVLPSSSPVSASGAPSRSPSALPSSSPSAPSFTQEESSGAPSWSPSAVPSLLSSSTPAESSSEPSSFPVFTGRPSSLPSLSNLPSLLTSQRPSLAPSGSPSTTPSKTPTIFPSMTPSVTNSAAPSSSPSIVPSASPSIVPSSAPTFPFCNVCGGDLMIGNPDGVVNDPFDATTPTRTCAEIEARGQEGLIAPQFCTVLTALVRDPCECQSVPTGAPSAAPIVTATPTFTGQTQAPSDVPSAGPSTTQSPTFVVDDTASPTPTATLVVMVGEFTSCNICGDNLVIGDLEGITLNPVDQTRPTCDEFDLAGRAGMIEPNLCQLLPAVVATSCDCMSSTPTTGSPTLAPVVINTGVPTTIMPVAPVSTGSATSPTTSTTSTPTTPGDAGSSAGRVSSLTTSSTALTLVVSVHMLLSSGMWCW
jgi:hypothetical protein